MDGVMSQRIVAWSRRMSRLSWVAGVALLPMAQEAQPQPSGLSASSIGAIILVLAVILPIVLGAGAAFIVWLISRGTPPAVVGAEPPKPAKPREVLPPGVHLPAPSIRPLILSLGLMVLAFGVVLRGFAIELTPDFQIPIIFVIGLLITLLGLFGWIRDDYKAARH